MSKVIIIGGGAAGMMAAIFAARSGHEVHIFEKNEKLGKKIYITGKGRCNLTNACDMETLLASMNSNYQFMYSSFYSFTNEQTMEFFEKCQVPLKVERGGRVFPVSDHASDVIGGLTRELAALGVLVHLNTAVMELLIEQGCCRGVLLQNRQKVMGDACIVTTGGISYPTTGSTGDGYRFAQMAGHKVTELLPGLVPMTVKEGYVRELQGLSLRNVNVRVFDGSKKLYEEFGEMLFTHYGVSGPCILSASSVIGRQLKERELTLQIDLKPALTFEQLDQRVLRDFSEGSNRQFKNAADKLFPAKLRPVMVELSQIDPGKQVNAVTREERHQFVRLIKEFSMTLTGLRDYKEAIITRGGVDVKEIDPGTMASKLAKGLYFAGEVLDLDALTGGFNLQIAWSTAYLAGNSIL